MFGSGAGVLGWEGGSVGRFGWVVGSGDGLGVGSGVGLLGCWVVGCCVLACWVGWLGAVRW